MRSEIVRFERVTKYFGRRKALNDLSLSIGRSRIVGLLGTNGSGKTTLLRHIVGIYLPTSGECYALGKKADQLAAADLARIGMVHQHENFLSWMSVRELLRYVGSYYPTWDFDMQLRLTSEFDLSLTTAVENLSPGQRQLVSIILATCHRPELLILDEPLSDLDPLARERTLLLLLDLFRETEATIVISSHLLNDIERVIDHVVCVDAGRVAVDEALDNLKERFAEWTVTDSDGRLPARFNESWIVSQEGDDRFRVLIVNDSERQLDAFRNRYGVAVEIRPLNLNRIFTTIVKC